LFFISGMWVNGPIAFGLGGEVADHRGRIWQRKTAHFMPGKKKRCEDEGGVTLSPWRGHHPKTRILPRRPSLWKHPPLPNSIMGWGTKLLMKGLLGTLIPTIVLPEVYFRTENRKDLVYL
jgi:hypothetical protein